MVHNSSYWQHSNCAKTTTPELQVSVVCRSFAAAARDLLASSDVLDLNPNTSDGPDLVDETGQVSFRLDTNLLQSWAGDLKCLNLESYTLPGLPALLQAARSLESLSLRCISALEAAQAEHVLLVCGQVQTVHILGCCIPGGLPAKMRQLTVWLAVVNEPNEGWDPDTVDILLFKLAWHKALRRLTLDFDTECRVIKLACPLCLPALDVSISMQYHSISLLDFSWLRRQPCSSLSFHVCICTASPTEQQELMRQLQPLPVSSLTLNFHDSQNTPRDVLRLWREPFPDVVFEHEWVPACPQHWLQHGLCAFSQHSQAKSACAHTLRGHGGEQAMQLTAAQVLWCTCSAQRGIMTGSTTAVLG